MWKNRWFQTSPKKANSLYVSRLNSGQRGRQTECVHALGYCYTLLLILVLWVPETCLCRRTFYRPTNWGRVGWDVISFVSTARHDAMQRYAWGGVGCGVISFVSTARHDAMLRSHGVGWGGVWYHSSVLQDMMRCYATHGVGLGVILFVSTARHDVMLLYAWGGVGWVVISFVITARHDVLLRYAWGGVGCDIIRQYCKTWCDATLRMGWGGVWYHSFPSPRQTQWFVVQVHSKSTMEMGTHWLRLSDRNWRSCKISHAVKRKGHFVRSSGFAAQNPVRAANHRKADVFFDGRLPHEIALAPQRNNNFWTIMGRCQVRRDVCAIGVLSPYRLDDYRILMIDPYSHIVLVSVGRLDRYHW